ncbi:MAG: NOG1 family protein [Halobacteriales archaeon]|nr:NOG1 family protein [Halobacteriales archaeon]
MIFESLPTTPTADELLDQAFSRAARAGRAKTGIEAQQSMLQTASNVLTDNLGRVSTDWPDFDAIDPFYRELADAIVEVDPLRASLSEVSWASRKTKELGREYQRRVANTNPDAARKLRKQAFARMASVVEEVAEDLERVGAARNDLRDLPDIRPDDPTIVIAGYPNVGKSSFVNAVTRASNRVAEYPFTTTGVQIGHVERDRIRYQLVDTPGLLDRPPAERNGIERQAASALAHVADGVLFLVDASGTCGYPLDDQLELREAVEAEFPDVPLLTVWNKADLEPVDGHERADEVDPDVAMSITEGTGVEAALDAIVEAIGYEPKLPFEES